MSMVSPKMRYLLHTFRAHQMQLLKGRCMCVWLPFERVGDHLSVAAGDVEHHRVLRFGHQAAHLDVWTPKQ